MGNTIQGPTFSAHYPRDFPCKQLDETSFSDLNALKTCITEIKGQSSHSQSASDIYILDTGNEKYFMKLFITGVPYNILQVPAGITGMPQSYGFLNVT